MKIAFVGKGGSGKTTLSSLFIRHLAANEAPVVAVDADINQHLGAALGLDEAEAAALPAMGAHLPLIKDYLRGTQPAHRLRRDDDQDHARRARARGCCGSARTTPSTTPAPGTVRLDGGDIRLMATGPFTEADLGVACYHSKVGAVELCLNHLVDGREEYVVVDMTAGSDSFASGMFTRFDMTFLVAEPTRKGVSVYRQYKEYARDFGVALKVVGNKVQGQDDLDFLRDEVGRRPAGDRRALRLGAGHGEGPPAPLRAWRTTNRHVPAGPAERRGRLVRAPRLGALHPPDGALPPEERGELGQREDRGRPGRPGRPRLRARRALRPSRAARAEARPPALDWARPDGLGRPRSLPLGLPGLGDARAPRRLGGEEGRPALLRGLADLQGAQLLQDLGSWASSQSASCRKETHRTSCLAQTVSIVSSTARI